MTPGLAAILADAVLAVHLAFIAFAAGGALAVLRWPRLAWLHLPALAWAAWSALAGAICPLTPLEQRLRAVAQEPGYTGGFIAHYLEPLIYPPGLTRGDQAALGGVLIGTNGLLYVLILRRARRRRERSAMRQARSLNR